MSTIESRWLEFRYLDELSTKDTLIHRLHPAAKLVTTLAFLVVTASFSKYELAAMLPLFLYLAVLIILGEIPWNLLVKRLLFALPFVVFVGVFNPLFDTTPLLQLGPISISGGIISFVSILLRFCMSVLAALALIGTTGINDLGAALQSMGVPRVLVNQMLFMYRYLHVLIEEVVRMVRAYTLRSPQDEKIRISFWGSLIGLLLMRTLNRAERVHQAMLCRGFNGEVRLANSRRLRVIDGIFFVFWISYFLLFRLFNFPQWLGALLTGR